MFLLTSLIVIIGDLRAIVNLNYFLILFHYYFILIQGVFYLFFLVDEDVILHQVKSVLAGECITVQLIPRFTSEI
jgi:hypothetical protein